MENKSFGLAHIKAEGAPLHPDDCRVAENWTAEQYDRWYARQLKAYNDYHGIQEE